MMVYATLADKGATNTDANGGRRGDIINYCIVLFRRAAKTQLKNIAVHGLRIVGGFSLCLAGRFSLCGAFSFCGCVVLYAVFVFGACKAFSGHCGRCFRFGVADCVLLFVLICSVMPLKLSVLRFVGVGGILYRVIFSWLVCGLFWL